MSTKTNLQLLLVLILSLICYCILFNANWLFDGSMTGDDYQFLQTTAIGKASHGSTWSSRFWPLGLSDYSVLLLFGSIGQTAMAHYAWNCITLVISCLLFYKLLYDITKNSLATFISLLFLFISSGFAAIHMECIYAERAIVFAIGICLFAINKAQKSQNSTWYILAFVSAVYSTYTKELVFMIWLVLSLSQLVINKLSKKDKYFYIALLLNSFIFISIYGYRRIFKPQKEVYATILSSVSDISLSQFTNEPILVCLLALFFIRGFYILFRNDRNHLFSDITLFSGIVYAFCYFLLKLHAGYYLYPSIALALPAIAVFISKSKLNICFGILSIALCGYLNYDYNKYILLNNWNHRITDHRIFESIVDKYRKGWKIYWLSAKTDKEKDLKYYHFDRLMCLNRFQHFLRYYNNNTPLPIKLEENFNNFATNEQNHSNCVILINNSTLDRENFKSTKVKFEKLSPKLLARLGSTFVYTINTEKTGE